MTELIKNSHDLASEKSSTTIDLVDLWLLLWARKWFIIIFSIAGSGLGLGYSLSLPNIYSSSALLAPQDSQNTSGLGALGSNLGGIASLAGVNLGGSGSDVALHIEVLKSKDFLYPFFEKYDVAKVLFAVREYDKNTGKQIVDSLIYHDGKWLQNPETGKSFKPTDFDVYERFIKIFNVKHNRTSDLVLVSIDSIDPMQAKVWVSGMVDEINDLLRLRELSERSKSINYLNTQLEKTNVAQMKAVFYGIIEEQTKQMLLAEVRNDFAFKVIESPVVAERKVSPRRAVICILAAIFSLLLACGLVIFRYFFVQLSKVDKD
ncbi:lipopolysaccharide biosynthesis protein [Pseudoalteromonas aurantia]|uniref:Wzz/FepE/Etk N-terminal domain-containing protein n=1 Tax=Pseudoalteromonas aurantia TaxID=43654 RepID=UPI00110B15D6|nr:Wzz/FepE/Etk N-terminal domain-containing protein [Pseudoalteromonas aurantia]TMO67082.1 lipopolysaccharide biosynthesis protein [Pseudoalteromonas aurantia]